MAESVGDTDVNPRKPMPLAVPIICTGLISILMTFCCIFCWVYYPTIKERVGIFYEAVIGYARSFRLGRRVQEPLGQDDQGNAGSIPLRRLRARGQRRSLRPQRRKAKSPYGTNRPQRRMSLDRSLQQQRMESQDPGPSGLLQGLEDKVTDSCIKPQSVEAKDKDGSPQPQRREARHKDFSYSLDINTEREAFGRGAHKDLKEATEKTSLLCKGEGATNAGRTLKYNSTNSL
ncbi:uncharacterized protein [Palaemon carinicauda]|uniref:uncharacterized protein n=1 Tax=Palaemon carinicauda TaxID=392227 RepID=UPI0035B5A3F8